MLGSWRPAQNQRPTLLLSFPHAGAMLAPLADAMLLGTPAARAELGLISSVLGSAAMNRLERAWINPHSPLPTGTLLYSPRRLTPIELDSFGRNGAAGTLYITVERFYGNDRPLCAELRRKASGHRHYFWWDKGSLSRGGLPWAPDVSSLWVVNHLGGRMHIQPTGGRETAVRFLFDFDRAEDEISLRRSMLRQSEDELDHLGHSPFILRQELVDLASTQISLDDAADAATAASMGVGSAPAEVMSGYAAKSPVVTRAMRMPSSPIWEGPVRLDDARRTLTRHSEPKPVAGITPVSRCHYGAMLCRGCGNEIGMGSWMIPGGTGMVHNEYDCFLRATRARVSSEADEYRSEVVRRSRASLDVCMPVEEGPVTTEIPDGSLIDLGRSGVNLDVESRVKPPKPTRNQKGTQLIESLSEERRDMVRRCMDGCCPFAGSDEPRMTCVGTCHRTLHGVACAQITHGHAVIGCFECPECQLRKVFGREPPYPDTAVRDAEETMLLVISRGAEKSGSGFADFVKLQSEWALETGKGEVIKLPVDSPASLMLFCTWLIRQRDRERSLVGIWRIAGIYMVRTGRPNLTSLSGEAKAHYSSLLDEHGVEEHPRTAVTPRMMYFLFHGGVIAKHCPKLFIEKRTKVDSFLEGACGLRVGEALTGGDYHGLLASHLFILVRLSDGLVTIEGVLEHSKTKFKRYVNCLGKTLGKAAIPCEQSLREYWDAAGFKKVGWEEGGYRVTTVDYVVLRVSFLGMKQERFDLLLQLLEKSKVLDVRRASASLAHRAKQRYTAKHSKDKRYINITGGATGCDNIAQVSLELSEAGFGEHEGKPGFMSVLWCRGLYFDLRTETASRTCRWTHRPHTPHCTRCSTRHTSCRTQRETQTHG